MSQNHTPHLAQEFLVRVSMRREERSHVLQHIDFADPQSS